MRVPLGESMVFMTIIYLGYSISFGAFFKICLGLEKSLGGGSIIVSFRAVGSLSISDSSSSPLNVLLLLQNFGAVSPSPGYSFQMLSISLNILLFCQIFSLGYSNLELSLTYLAVCSVYALLCVDDLFNEDKNFSLFCLQELKFSRMSSIFRLPSLFTLANVFFYYFSELSFLSFFQGKRFWSVTCQRGCCPLMGGLEQLGLYYLYGMLGAVSLKMNLSLMQLSSWSSDFPSVSSVEILEYLRFSTYLVRLSTSKA